MTDSTIDTEVTAPTTPAPAGAPSTAPASDATDGAAAVADAPAFDAERRATELAILDALRSVVDPEIGMNVVELALIRQIILGPDSTEVKMILTTPFCPYAGIDDRPGQGGRGNGRGTRRQGDAARRALGSARRGPDVVTSA